MYWKQPKDIHVVYEALSAIADNRISLINDTKAKCFSTSGNKYYEIEYNPETKSIISNDNMAYYVKEISYPMISYLLITNKIDFNKEILKQLRNIKWKDINQKNRNNYMKSVEEVLESIEEASDRRLLIEEANRIFEIILNLELKCLGELRFPPKEY